MEERVSSFETAADWYEDFFEGVALDLWERACSVDQTRAECDLIESLMSLPPDACLLDLPCGLGRHLIEMASRGYRMTGVDLSREAIERVAASAQRLGVPVELIQGDMRERRFDVSFDGAFCLGNSFGYFDFDGSLEFVKAVSGALKPGSGFLLETGVAAESILPNLDEKNWFEVEDMVLLMENEYQVQESRLDTRFTVVHQGSTQVMCASHHVFTVSDIARMFRAAGLQIKDLFSSADQKRYSVGDPNLIVFAAKD